MTFAGVVISSFVIATLAATIFIGRVKAIGCGLPFVSVAALMLYFLFVGMGSSTDGVAIPLVAMATAAGSIPGALIGVGLRALYDRLTQH